MKNNQDQNSDRKWKKILDERDRNCIWLKDRLFDLDYPGLYLGDELNTFHFDWDLAVNENRIDETWRVALINLIASKFTFAAPAIMLFYEQLHELHPDWVIERSLCPPTKYNMERMKIDGIRPFAVESKMPLKAFDVLCLSMDLSGSGVAVPWLLLLSGIPVRSKDRGQSDPFIIMGGSALVNPEPYREFCDILFLGEGEEILPQLIDMLREGRRRGLSREAILLKVARNWDCLYVPRFYEERFDMGGRFAGTFPLRKDVPDCLHFYHVKDLDAAFMSSKPFLNFCTNAADTSHYEISRGCEGRCSFCMSGFTSLPFRTRSADLIRENTNKIIHETGNTFVTPVSFNSVSHPQINQIVRALTGAVGDRIKIASLRMDGFHNNPELCCFISMQKRGRIAFGVEGSSQRLRDLVSKNLTEDQILDTMREASRRRFSIIKFMMICNLPTETEADLYELYELAVKIKQVFEEESTPKRRLPNLQISWTSLIVSPHTPLQWAPVTMTLSPAYAAFTDKIRELGFRTYTPKITADDLMAQLFLRGDGRLSGLLQYLAEEGDLRHNDLYGQEIYDKAIRYLHDHGLPPPEEWFREYGKDDPLPWDIVASPASKAYLYKRYQAMQQGRPASEPVCTEQCSGCGACDRTHQKLLQDMPAKRESDRKINLHHPVREKAFQAMQHVLMEFTYDDLHSVVIPSYWDCEIRRALYQSGISFDPDSVECFGSREYSDHAAAGISVTNISLCEKVDLDHLRQRMEEYAINFRIKSLRETEKPQRTVTATYRMPLPEKMDSEKISSIIKNKLSEKEWFYRKASPYVYPRNLRWTIQQLDVKDDRLYITMGPKLSDPSLVYRYLFDIPANQKLSQIPERVGFTFENKGVLDRALTRETRDGYLRFLRENKGMLDYALTIEGDADRESLEEGTEREKTYEDIEGYISGNICVMDLYRLIQREYRHLPDYQLPRYLPGLIEYAKKGHHTEEGDVSLFPENHPLSPPPFPVSSAEDDPAYKDLMDYI